MRELSRARSRKEQLTSAAPRKFVPFFYIDPNRHLVDKDFFEDDAINDDEDLADVIGDARVRRRAPHSHEETDE